MTRVNKYERFYRPLSANKEFRAEFNSFVLGCFTNFFTLLFSASVSAIPEGPMKRDAFKLEKRNRSDLSPDTENCRNFELI